jgi:hypothetical protein
LATVKLKRKGDQVLATDTKGEQFLVDIVWLRPATGIGKEISLLTENSRSIIIESIDKLDQLSRKIAREELNKNYIIPVIKRIVSTQIYLGNRYFEVETDRGDYKFVVKNPYTAIRESGDGILIRDVMGNLYSITDISQLDRKSQNELDRIL